MEDYRARRFTPDEVSAIVHRALQDRSSLDTISYEELVETAGELNIPVGRLQEAIEQQESRGQIEAAKAVVMRRRRQDFREHLVAYCIVNGGIMMLNLITSPEYLWFLFPVIGWGIGLAFHAADTFMVNEENLERAAARHLKKEAQRAQRKERGGKSSFQFKARY